MSRHEIIQKFVGCVKTCFPESQTRANEWMLTKCCGVMDMLNEFCSSKYSCVAFFESILEKDYEIMSRLLLILEIPGFDFMLCSIKLGVASFIGHCSATIPISGTKASQILISFRRELRRILTRNEIDQDISEKGNCNTTGILDQAISQTVSRDLIQRAIRLQELSAYNSSDEIIDVNLAGLIFSNRRMQALNFNHMKSLLIEQEKHSKRAEQEMGILKSEKEQLFKNQCNIEASFERERIQMKLERKAEVTSLNDLRIEERLDREQKFSDIENSLVEIKKEKTIMDETNKSLKSHMTKLQQEYNENLHKINEMNSTIKEMQTNFNEKALKEKKRIEELGHNMTKLQECLKEADATNSSWTDKYSGLLDEQNVTEAFLEDVMFKLISFADLYSTMENKFEEEKATLKDNLVASDKRLEETKSKCQNFEKQASMYKEQNEELRRAYEKLKRVYKDKNQDRDRKPMRTLAYMNTVPDTSLGSFQQPKRRTKHGKKQPKENEYIPHSEKRLISKSNDKRKAFHIVKR